MLLTHPDDLHRTSAGAVGGGRKVAVSVPDGIIGIFHWHNSSGRTMALGSTQTLTGVIILGCQGGRYVGLTTWPPSFADCLEILRVWTSWNLKGLFRPVQIAYGLLHTVRLSCARKIGFVSSLRNSLFCGFLSVEVFVTGHSNREVWYQQPLAVTWCRSLTCTAS